MPLQHSNRPNEKNHTQSKNKPLQPLTSEPVQRSTIHRLKTYELSLSNIAYATRYTHIRTHTIRQQTSDWCFYLCGQRAIFRLFISHQLPSRNRNKGQAGSLFPQPLVRSRIPTYEYSVYHTEAIYLQSFFSSFLAFSLYAANVTLILFSLPKKIALNTLA